MPDFFGFLSSEFIPHVANIALLISAVIVGVLLFFLHRFDKAIKPLSTDLEKTIEFVRKLKQPLDVEQYNLLSTFFENSSILSHPWSEFRDSLIVPKEGDTDRTVFNTKQSEAYFTEDVVIRRHVDLDLYMAIPGILTALGLIGTFLAIYIALAQLQFKAGQVVDITPFINTLGGKFLASIVGLVAAAIGLWIERSRTGELTRLLHELCVGLNEKIKQAPPQIVTLGALLKGVSGKLSLLRAEIPNKRELKKELGQLRSELTQFASEVASNQTVFFSQIANLGQTVSAIQQSTDSAFQRRDEMLKDMIEQVAVGFREALASAANEEIKRLANSIEEIVTATTKLKDSVSAADSHFQELISAQRNQLDDLLTYQSEQCDKVIENQRNQFVVISGELKNHMDSVLESSQRQLSDHIKVLSAALDSLSQKQDERSSQIHQSQTERIQSMLQALQASANESADVAKLVTNNTTEWADNVSAQLRDVLNLAATEAVTLKQTGANLTELQSGFQTAIENNTQTVKELESMSKLISRAAQALSTNDIAMRKSAEQQQQAMVLFEAQMKGYQALLEKHMTLWAEQKTSLAGLESSLSKVTDVFVVLSKSTQAAPASVSGGGNHS
ncbi:MAG: hypothetical protein K2W95_18560 [Candidatus Obscuribacterales bacterium]|nr:hypothetical protein [Candidatus Obscuribacterales bacterium]